MNYKKLLSILIFSFFFVCVSVASRTVNQYEKTDTYGDFKITELREPKDLRPLFKIVDIRRNSTGSIYLYIEKPVTNLKEMLRFFECEAQVSNKEGIVLEKSFPYIFYKKRCKCSENSYRVVDVDKNCPDSCKKGKDFYIKLDHQFSGNEEIIFGSEKYGYLFLIEFRN
jgi:hypothetical protein